MELVGLEPTTSWVRSSLTAMLRAPRLQVFLGEHLECRNISRNTLHRDLQGFAAAARAGDEIARRRGELRSERPTPEANR
jgi:hypothetical protein